MIHPCRALFLSAVGRARSNDVGASFFVLCGRGPSPSLVSPFTYTLYNGNGNGSNAVPYVFVGLFRWVQLPCNQPTSVNDTQIADDTHRHTPAPGHTLLKSQAS